VRFEKRADAGEKLSQSAHQADGCSPLPFSVLGGEKHRISPAEAQRGEGSEGCNALTFSIACLLFASRAPKLWFDNTDAL
jgi:hypothetical protein